MLRCAFGEEQKRTVFQDNTGRISFCLGPSPQSSDLKTPLSAPSAPLPQGWVQSSELWQCNGDFLISVPI